MKIDENQPREKMEILNLFGFILYAVLGLWSIVALLASIAFAFSSRYEGIRSFFRIKLSETNAYTLWTLLVALTLLSIALFGRNIVNRTKQYII